MNDDKITILYGSSRISLFNSLYPFIVSKYASHFTFTADPEYCLKSDFNRAIIIVRYLKNELNKDESSVGLLKKIRQKYEKVVFFDDSDGSDSFHFEYMPYVDLYLKKQILKDQKQYFRSLYGRQPFSDYYHNYFGVEDEEHEKYRPPLMEEKHLKKIQLSWNLGMGSFPLKRWKIRVGRFVLSKFFPLSWMSLVYDNPQNYHVKPVSESHEINKIQARFDAANYSNNSIAFQRKLLLEKAGRHPDSFLTGRIPKSEYDKEQERVTGVLSPFGWGEICFRDFEAVLQKTALLKPDMDHLKTWPDIYQPNETYIPVSWDGIDLYEKSQLIRTDESLRKRITENAHQIYMDAFDKIDDKIYDLITSIVQR